MLERSRPVTGEARVMSTVKIDLQEGLAALLPETDQTIQEAARRASSSRPPLLEKLLRGSRCVVDAPFLVGLLDSVRG